MTEGIYSGWTAPLIDRAVAIVWLDMPARLAVRRIVWGHLRRSLAGNNPHKGLRLLFRFCRDVWEDLPRAAATGDQLRHDVSLNSRPTVQERLHPYKEKVIHCRTPQDVD